MPSDPTRPRPRAIPSWAVALSLFGLTAGLCAMIWYGTGPPFLDKPSTRSELLLQFAATAGTAREVVRGEGGGAGLFQDGLVLDWRLFVPGYAAALAGAFGIGHLLLHRESVRRWARRGLALTAVVVLADCGENVFLWRALNRLDGDPVADLTWASCCAQVKWALVVPLAAAALLMVLTVGFRVLWPPSVARRPQADGADTPAVVAHAHRLANGTQEWNDPDVILPPAAPHDGEPRSEWTAPGPERPGETPSPQAPETGAAARRRTRAYQPPGRPPAEIGFCVSGGGIRSASVTLGALQALREQLLKARYLVSVSGGGYTAGALQLALTGARVKDQDESAPPPTGLARPGDVFEPGSPEEDHVRRHAKYLADAPKEKADAVGAVLRGLTVSLGMLALLFAVAGQLLHASSTPGCR
ncbi:patatin-like phospholipase family protein [Streptomyces sp. PmtG]